MSLVNEVKPEMSYREYMRQYQAARREKMKAELGEAEVRRLLREKQARYRERLRLARSAA